MKTAAIAVDGLSKTFRGKKLQKVVALDQLSLEVTAGQVFGFLGPNGAGKSTTIKILTGQIRPSSGKATIFGVPVNRLEARSRIGYLPENPSFYDFLSAREYLHFVGKIFSMPQSSVRKEAENVLNKLNLFDAADRPIRSYSKGMVQRLGIAQALLHDPDLYILDEPMSGLDPIGRALVKDIILDLKQRGKTIFFSTHITNDVEMTCDNFAIVNKGVLEVSSTVAAIVNDVDKSAYSIISSTGEGEVVQHCREIELAETIQKLIAQGHSIKQVVRQQRSLENYFLDIVGRRSQ